MKYSVHVCLDPAVRKLEISLPDIQDILYSEHPPEVRVPIHNHLRRKSMGHFFQLSVFQKLSSLFQE